MLAVAVYLMVAVSFSQVSLFLGHGLFGVAFVLLACSLRLCPRSPLVNPAVCYIETVSFSAYLGHFAVLDLVGIAADSWVFGETTHPSVRFIVLLAATLAGTILVATATYHMIELPGQAVGRFVIRRLEGSPAAGRPTGGGRDLNIKSEGAPSDEVRPPREGR